MDGGEGVEVGAGVEIDGADSIGEGGFRGGCWVTGSDLLLRGFVGEEVLVWGVGCY